MPISFPNIPANVLLPLFYADITAAQEPFAANLKMLLIGQMNKGGTKYSEGPAIPNVPYLLSRSMATDLFGRGSQLEGMYGHARENNPWGEIWGISSGMDAIELRATMKITAIADATATRSGVARIFIAGREIRWRVYPTDTKAQIVNRLLYAINAARTYVVADYGTPPVNTELHLTARWAGHTGNYINVSFVGIPGRAQVSSPEYWLTTKVIQLSSSQLQGGSMNIDLPSIFAGIKERPYDIFVLPHITNGLAVQISDFMDESAGRWSPFQQLYGHVVCGLEGNFTTCHTFLSTYCNDPHLSILCIMTSLNPQWEWASALAGIMMAHWTAPPELSRPLQTLEIRGLHVGTEEDQNWTKMERQQLLEVGGSTFHTDSDYTCRIDRIRTTRKYNLFGDPDPSWADAITMFQAMYFVRAMRTKITGAFPRCALSTYPTGINGFTSPLEIRTAICQEYRRLQSLGLVENYSLFAQYLVVERNSIDRNRVDVLMRPDFVNQLRVVAVLVETHLELDPSYTLESTAGPPAIAA